MEIRNDRTISSIPESKKQEFSLEKCPGNKSIKHLTSECAIKRGVDGDTAGNIGNLLLTDTKTNWEDLADRSPAEKIKKTCRARLSGEISTYYE